MNTGLGPFYDGVSHFALTPEDLLPALALALLAGQKGSRTGRLALFALPGAWLLGGLAGLAFPTISSAPALTTVSFLALGGLVAADARLRPEWVTALAAVVGLLHGYLNGAAMAQAKLGALGLVGIVATLFVVGRPGRGARRRDPRAVGADRRPRGGQLDRRDRPAAPGLVAPGGVRAHTRPNEAWWPTRPQNRRDREGRANREEHPALRGMTSRRSIPHPVCYH